MIKRLEKNYVADIDKLLVEFDKEHPEKSASQQAEIAKHRRIAELRDNPDAQQKPAQIWEDF